MEQFKNEFTEYLSMLIRETLKESHKQLGITLRDFNTNNWIIIVPEWSELAGYDTILDFPIYTCNSLVENFKIAIPSAQEQDRKILKVFNELVELLPMNHIGD